MHRVDLDMRPGIGEIRFYGLSQPLDPMAWYYIAQTDHAIAVVRINLRGFNNQFCVLADSFGSAGQHDLVT